MIEVERLAKVFADRGETNVAVNGISFSVADGEFFTLLGPSGCGKTTTLRCIAGLERPSSGLVRLNGQLVYDNRELVPTHRRDIGMVFQSYAIWPHLSVFANAAFPLRVQRHRSSRSDIERQVNEALALVGLKDLGHRSATNLSGGQQQRLALARAIVRKPKVLLLDEPLSNLDARLREHMREEIRTLQQRLDLTTILVTHDQVEALSMSSRIAVMRDGEIAQVGTPEEVYRRPTSMFVCNFVGGTNLVRGVVSAVSGSADGATVIVEGPFGSLEGVLGGADVKVGERAIAAIRHEHVWIEPGVDTRASAQRGANQVAGTIEAYMFEGPSLDISVRVGSSVVRVRTTSLADGLSVGTPVALTLPRDALRVFADEGSAGTSADPPSSSAAMPAAQIATT
jgi:iron(III) transport system ATP-binding protein